MKASALDIQTEHNSALKLNVLPLTNTCLGKTQQSVSLADYEGIK